MAPRANWKGFLRLSLVTCPVALYPATSDTEKVSFNQINRKTGHRIKYAKVDAETGEEVANEDIMKGYKIDTDTYIELSKEELEDIALESISDAVGFSKNYLCKLFKKEMDTTIVTYITQARMETAKKLLTW